MKKRCKGHFMLATLLVLAVMVGCLDGIEARAGEGGARKTFVWNGKEITITGGKDVRVVIEEPFAEITIGQHVFMVDELGVSVNRDDYALEFYERVDFRVHEQHIQVSADGKRVAVVDLFQPGLATPEPPQVPEPVAAEAPEPMQQPVPREGAVVLTPADVSMAKSVIQQNTMSIPGFGVGERIQVGTGSFSPADALVLYFLRFHRERGVCPPVSAMSQALTQLNDAEVHRKAAAIFWLDYSSAKNTGPFISKPTGLRDAFQWYISTKQTERLRISNARLQDFVGATEAWRRAMEGQRQFWEKNQAREQEFILKRGAYRTLLDAQAAVAAAQNAVGSSR